VSDASERVQELAIEAGAEDLDPEDGSLTIYTGPNALYEITEALQSAGVETLVSQLTKLPQMETELSESDANKVLAFLDALEELDDVQDVYSNANLDAVGVTG
jgi:transcriptional/translational regulatory protein YebC/TACO1